MAHHIDRRGASTQHDCMPREPATRAMHFVYTHDGRWWTAEAPTLRGAYSQGRTQASARRNLTSAIRDLLAAYRELGEAPPFVEVAVERARVA